MTLRLLLPLLLAACAPDAGNSLAGRSGEANGSGAQASRPAGAPASGVNDVIGATPGPCGATRATAFLGKTYRPEMDAEIKRVSGASAIRRVRPTGEDPTDAPPADRRLNILLNDSGQIILLDCG